jgi:cytochrome c55X
MLGQEQHALAVLLALLLAGKPADPPPERREQILGLMRSECGACHQAKLRDGFGPPLVPEALVGRSLGELTAAILAGKPETQMPSWAEALTIGEARWLAHVLRDGTAASLSQQRPAA